MAKNYLYFPHCGKINSPQGDINSRASEILSRAKPDN